MWQHFGLLFGFYSQWSCLAKAFLMAFLLAMLVSSCLPVLVLPLSSRAERKSNSFSAEYHQPRSIKVSARFLCWVEVINELYEEVLTRLA